MINEIQRKFLDSLPQDKLNRIIEVKPWNPRSTELAQEIIQDIKKLDPNLQASLAGSSALHIAGENDLDIGGLAAPSELQEHATKLLPLFGKPHSTGKGHIGWTFEREGFNISFYIADPASQNTKVQMDFFRLMLENPDLAKEYENIKLKMNGKTYKEYQSAKYEFFNRVLGDS